MTIRSSVNIRAINESYMAFEEACDRAPEGTFEWSKDLRQDIGETCDAFLALMRSKGVETCNCDGIREIEVMLFAMLRDKNPDSEIQSAIGLGETLRDPAFDGESIIRGLERDRDAIAQLAEAAMLQVGVLPGSYRREVEELTSGAGDLWTVRVASSEDPMNYAEIEVRAVTDQEAADKAEAHARKHVDMYFDDPPTPRYVADRVNIYRSEEEDESA